MRTVDIICGAVVWGFGGTFLLYITGFFRWVRSWWNPGDKPPTRYDFDKNPPKSLFAAPEPENQPLYKEFFVKRGSRWVRQKWRS